MKKSEIIFGILRIPVDFAAVFLAFLLAYQIRSRTDLIPGIQFPIDSAHFMPWNEYFTFSIFASIGLIIIMAASRAYSLKVTTSQSRELFQAFLSSIIWLGFVMAYFFLARITFFSRLVLGMSFIFAILFLTLGRVIIRGIHFIVLKNGIGKRKILFVGINEIANRLFQQFKQDPRYEIIGAIDTEKIKKHPPFPFLGNVSQLKYLVKKHFIDEIIQTKQDLTETQAKDILEFCREHQLQYSFIPDLLEVQLTNVELSQVARLPLISMKPTPLDGWGKVLKRSFDLIGGITLTLLCSPIMLVTAVIIKLDSPGTIFFTYLDDGKKVKRVGEKGNLFHCYKFRTMKMKTHNLRYTALAEKNKRKGTPMVKIENDPRITRIGTFLRKFSIDELPQLFNIIKGDMSLVGPRPHLPEEVAQYKKHHKFVFTLKPGMTGMAQVNGRSDLDFEEEVKLDTYYIEHWSLWLDLKIIIRTIFVVLSGKAE